MTTMKKVGMVAPFKGLQVGGVIGRGRRSRKREHEVSVVGRGGHEQIGIVIRDAGHRRRFVPIVQPVA